MTKLQAIKFIKILKNLDKNKLLDFEKFLNSPYFLERKDLPKLFKEIKKYYPAFNSKNFDKKILFKKAFPEKNYSDELLRKYFSELHKMLILYFPISSFKNEDISSDRKVAEVNFNHGNLEEAEKKLNSTIETLKAKKIRDQNYHYDMFLNEQLMFCIYQKTDSIKNEMLLNSMGDHLIKSFVIHLLKHYTVINSYELQYHHLPVLNKILELSETEELKNDPAVMIYYYSYKVTSEPENHECYYALKKLIFKNEFLLSEVELSTIYQLMNNYCSSRIDFGLKEFYQEKFEVSEKIIKIELITKGILNINYFTSIIVSALSINKIKWAESLIHQYKNHLSNDNKEGRMNYVNAYLQMYKKNYPLALEFLSKTNFADPYEKLRVKILDMRIHYENGTYESVLYLADAFKHFLFKYESITPAVRERTNNFINITAQLAKYKLSNKKNSRANIILKKPASNYIWLSEKIKEL